MIQNGDLELKDLEQVFSGLFNKTGIKILGFCTRNVSKNQR